MSKESKMRKASAILSDMAGHQMMIETLYKDVYAILEECDLLDEYGDALSECESEYDYESLSCDIANDSQDIEE